MGPALFRFELMWLEESNFPDLVRGWWKDLNVSGWEGYRIVTKLKRLKALMKDWAARQFKIVEQSLTGLFHDIQQIDIKEESGIISQRLF